MDAESLAKSLEALWTALTFKQGVFLGIATWMAASRTFLKFVSKWLQSGMSTLVDRAVESKLTQDDDIAERILGSRLYRIVAFFIDWLASVKMPTSETYLAAVEKRGAKS